MHDISLKHFLEQPLHSYIEEEMSLVNSFNSYLLPLTIDYKRSRSTSGIEVICNGTGEPQGFNGSYLAIYFVRLNDLLSSCLVSTLFAQSPVLSNNNNIVGN
jgi:hypothetical protein